MPNSVQQTFVGRENGTDTKNGCKEATVNHDLLQYSNLPFTGLYSEIEPCLSLKQYDSYDNTLTRGAFDWGIRNFGFPIEHKIRKRISRQILFIEIHVG